MSLVKRFCGTLAACTLVSTLASTALAEMKIAVVDTQRAVMETEDGLRAQAALKKHFDKRQRDLDDKQVALQKEREDIEKQKDVLSKQALQARVDKWQKEMAELQTVFVDYNKELQKKQGEMTQPIFQKTMSIIRRIATQNGYDLVVDKQAVPYHRSDLDLTDRVITEYNQTAETAPAASGKPASTPPAPAAAKKP
ncbi:MAG TPA: OmpH family outer membrane protein [Polyangiaceae bacterium]|nr:OmpH family outer membrane protein [Polyangiaceae bacterium]